MFISDLPSEASSDLQKYDPYEECSNLQGECYISSQDVQGQILGRALKSKLVRRVSHITINDGSTLTLILRMGGWRFNLLCILCPFLAVYWASRITRSIQSMSPMTEITGIEEIDVIWKHSSLGNWYGTDLHTAEDVVQIYFQEDTLLLQIEDTSEKPSVESDSFVDRLYKATGREEEEEVLETSHEDLSPDLIENIVKSNTSFFGNYGDDFIRALILKRNYSEEETPSKDFTCLGESTGIEEAIDHEIYHQREMVFDYHGSYPTEEGMKDITQEAFTLVMKSLNQS